MQKESINFKETFSPVSSKDSFMIIMALMAHFDLELHQMDVKTMFFNGDIGGIIVYLHGIFIYKPSFLVIFSYFSFFYSFFTSFLSKTLLNLPRSMNHSSQ